MAVEKTGSGVQRVGVGGPTTARGRVCVCVARFVRSLSIRPVAFRACRVRCVPFRRGVTTNYYYDFVIRFPYENNFFGINNLPPRTF